MNWREYRQMFQVEDYHWWYVALHELILSVIASEHQTVGPLTILDAGCGTGRLCQLLGKFGSVTGFDFNAEAISYCRERGLQHIFQADLNDVVLPTGRYDVVTSIDTLYHQAIDDESVILEKFFKALKPGGILILNLVAHEYLRSSHDIAVHTRKRYTLPEVVAMVERAGFTLEKSTYRLAVLFPLIACFRLLRKRSKSVLPREKIDSDLIPLHPVLNRFLLAMVRSENRFLRHGKLSLGTSVFAVARKNKKGELNDSPPLLI